jgi:hypothetical protein
MLKECNEDKPVVDPEVGYQVDAEHSRESESVDGGRHSGKPEHDAQIRENDGAALVRSKHDGVRVEVWRNMRPVSLQREKYSRLVLLG